MAGMDLVTEQEMMATALDTARTKLGNPITL